MARKIALLIGVGQYGDGLKPLQCPENGVAAMRAVLKHPDIGGFHEVVTLVNPSVGEMRSRICEVYARTTQQDLVLFYFTGHGIKDMTGDFYLTTAQTQLFENGRPNAGTAVEAHFLKREVSNSLATRKVIILDCCFGAAFADGFLAMNDGSIDVEAQLGGKGWCVLTASTSLRYALEKEGEVLSVYTRYLVEGLKTGAAAPDGQEFISARSLHEYVAAKVKVAAPAMEPVMFNRQQGYDIVVAQAQIDSAQRYRRQVEAKVHEGSIWPAGRAALDEWQQRLAISAQQAGEIEAEVLRPYQERQKHLMVYTAALEAEKGYTYPLEERAVRDLKDLQRLLSLRDKDTRPVEKRVLGEPIERFSSRSPTAQIQMSVWHSQPYLSQPDVPALNVSAPNMPAPDMPAPNMPVPIASLAPQPAQLKTFQFETVKTDRWGKIVKKLLAEATAFVEDLGHGISLEMVKIPGGTFMMGAPDGEEGRRRSDYPQVETTVSGFWMGKYAITRSQWQAAMSAQDHRDLENNLPIGNVFWTDAVEFCHWLSNQTGRIYRLPSSAQWEYACRAGTTTPFHFGETITTGLANYNGNYTYQRGPQGKYRQSATKVGRFMPNLFGLYDMHGNVWEWCIENWHDFHASGLMGDSAWRLSGQKKSLRGGSWAYSPTNCRCAYQLEYPFHSRIDDIGFRVICVDHNSLRGASPDYRRTPDRRTPDRRAPDRRAIDQDKSSQTASN